MVAHQSGEAELRARRDDAVRARQRQVGTHRGSRVRPARHHRVDHLDRADTLDHRPDRGEIPEPLVLAAYQCADQPAGQLLGDLRGAAQVLLRHDPGLAAHSGRLHQVVVDPAVRASLLDHRGHVWVKHDLECEVKRCNRKYTPRSTYTGNSR